MPIVEVSEVEVSGGTAELRTFSLDAPIPGSSSVSYALFFSGQATGERQPQVGLAIAAPGAREWVFPTNVHRPDVLVANPDLPWAETSGFKVGISTVRVPKEFELDISVLLEDQSRVPLAKVRGRRAPLLRNEDHGIQPILITAMGRTGTTWVTRLLGEHPRALSYRPLEYEPRIANYWTEVFLTLAEPASYIQSLRPDMYGDKWWIGTQRNAPEPLEEYDPATGNWLGKEQVHELIDFSKGRVEAFYRRAAKLAGKQPLFFVEKSWAGAPLGVILEDVYPRGREIFLVRDFRDMTASLIAYNRKLGFGHFGRQAFESDEEFIRLQLSRDARWLAKCWRLRSHDTFLLKYEDLVMNPKDTLEALFAHIGVESDGETIEQVLRRVDENADAEALNTHRTIAESHKSVGRWENDLDDTLKEVCEEAFAKPLATFGYS